MPLTLREIRKNCEQARERMAQARHEHFAFGAFNLDDEPTLRAVVQAAADKKAPVLV
jgi:fructose/tagatose bisphosphate aldolase